MAPNTAGARHLRRSPGPEQSVSSRFRKRQPGQVAVSFAEASSAGEITCGAK